MGRMISVIGGSTRGVGDGGLATNEVGAPTQNIVSSYILMGSFILWRWVGRMRFGGSFREISDSARDSISAILYHKSGSNGVQGHVLLHLHLPPSSSKPCTTTSICFYMREPYVLRMTYFYQAVKLSEHLLMEDYHSALV